MDDGNDNGPGEPTVVVVTPGEGATVTGGEGGKIQDAGEVAETVTDAAVAIAEIEADRDIALAVIHTDADAERAAQYHSEELEQCRIRIAALEAENEALKNPPPLILVQSEEPPPNPSPEPENAEGDPPVQEPEAVAENPPEPPPRKRKPHRWI